MGYEDGRAGKTGRIGEAEPKQFLQAHGFSAVKPAGKDIGVDLIISSNMNPEINAKAQVKGRRQIKNPRWFQLSITPSQIMAGWSRGIELKELWQQKIKMVDFWIMVSIPLKEVWVIPSIIVMEIAVLNSIKYSSRLDNQYKEPHYRKDGKIAKKQKELNLDLVIDRIPIWQKFGDYRNNMDSLLEYFSLKKHLEKLL